VLEPILLVLESWVIRGFRSIGSVVTPDGGEPAVDGGEVRMTAAAQSTTIHREHAN
jgi:hypothetical protein